MKQQKQVKKTLLEFFSEIKDPRRKEGKMHELNVILIIAIMAVMSWFTWERAMWDFVEKNAKWLRKYLKPKKGYLPSYQTIDWVLTKIWFEKITNAFNKRALQEWIEIKELDQVALDWKWICWTLKDPNWHRQKFVSLVSAFHTKDSQLLWAKVINNGKESEIPAVKNLIDMLWLEWVVFTADALHCQKETVKKIVKSKNHYLIWVKWNQKTLKNTIKEKSKKKQNL